MEEAQVLQDRAERAQEGCCDDGQLAGRLGVMITQQLQRAREETGCKKHQEPLKIFCKQDLALLCLVCSMSKSHRSHLVLPLEEAAQDFKEQIQDKLQNLQEEVIAVQRIKLAREQEATECLEGVNLKKQKIVQEFQQLHLFLEEQKGHLLAQLNKLEEEIKKVRDENLTTLSDNISALEGCLKDLEREYQRPDGEFLQNLKETLSRYEKSIFLCPVQRRSYLTTEYHEVSQKSLVLTEMFKKFKGTLEARLKSGRRPCLNGMFKEFAVQPEDIWTQRAADWVETFRKENVELDQLTANPKLMVACNGRTVKHRDQPQMLPDNPQRFDSEPFVLGCVGFCSGRQCWVVSIEQGQSWAVGVAKGSVKRKGTISISPEQGIWAIEECWGQFQALSSRWMSLTLLRKPRKIRVCLDYERGWVSFFDADLDAQIFTFPPVSFHQEIIYPWFWVGPGSHLSLSS